MSIKAGVLGVSGYTGQTLIRWLSQHPKFSISALFSSSMTGKYADHYSAFSGLVLPKVMPFSINDCEGLDILFLAVPHTTAMAIVKAVHDALPALKIVDLSADFRLKHPGQYASAYGVDHVCSSLLEAAVYGLPEVYAQQIRSTWLVANPGCYATAVELALLPLVSIVPLNQRIVVDAKSGVTGAGKSLKSSLMYCEVSERVSAYATGVHRHVPEIVQETGFNRVMFSPHLVPMMRGIECAIYSEVPPSLTNDVVSLYRAFYSEHPFVTVYDATIQPNTAMVVGSNQCAIFPMVVADCLVVFSLIDNLVKGAGGQAIQNANIMFGLDQTTGLTTCP